MVKAAIGFGAEEENGRNTTVGNEMTRLGKQVTWRDQEENLAINMETDRRIKKLSNKHNGAVPTARQATSAAQRQVYLPQQLGSINNKFFFWVMLQKERPEGITTRRTSTVPTTEHILDDISRTLLGHDDSSSSKYIHHKNP